MKCELFRKGEEVEVTSNELGFEGSWFVSTIQRRLKKKSQYSVEYKTLIDDAETYTPLKEIVDSTNVRPCPPPSTTSLFEVNEEVDVFLNDGWWKGVVSKVVEVGVKYCVFFQPTKEEKEFDWEDLRVHLDWVDGEWVKPPPCQINREEKVVIEQKEGSVQSPDPIGNSALNTDMTIPRTPSGAGDAVLENVLSSSRNIYGRMDDQSTPKETTAPSYTVFKSQVNMKQSDPKRVAEFARPFKKVRKGKATESPTCLKACHARGTSTGSPMEEQNVLSFPSRGRRRNVIVSGDTEKSYEQWQNKQHIVLPTGQMKEPLRSTEIEVQGLGEVDSQTEGLKKKRKRSAGSGKKPKSRSTKALGMLSQSEGLENQSSGKKMTDVPTECTPLSSHISEEHQPLSIFPEKSSSHKVTDVGEVISGDSELIGFPKPFEQGSDRQHIDLPTRQIKETLCSPDIEPHGLGAVDSQTEKVLKRKRGRPLGSGKKPKRENTQDLGMASQSNGVENESASEKMTDNQIECIPLLNHTEDDHQPLSMFVKKSSSHIVQDIGGPEHESAIQETTDVQTQYTPLTSYIADGHQKSRSHMVKDIGVRHPFWHSVGPEDKSSNRETTDVHTESTQVSSDVADEHRPLSVLFEKSRSHLMKDNGGVMDKRTEDVLKRKSEQSKSSRKKASGKGPEHEPASEEMMAIQIESTPLLSHNLEKNQSLHLHVDQSTSPTVDEGPDHDPVSKEITLQSESTHLLGHSAEKNQSLLPHVEQYDLATMNDIGGPEHESACKDLTVQAESTQMLSHNAEKLHVEQSNSHTVNDNGGVSSGNQLLPNTISLIDSSIESLVLPASSNLVESLALQEYTTVDDPYRYDNASGDERALQSANFTANTVSSQDEGPLQVIPNTISLIDSSMESLVLPASSNVVESSSLQGNASGDERALCSANFTANTVSSQDEGPLQVGSLPFTKRSDMWGILESNEVFQVMHQQPHFRSLEKYNEEVREGYALGHMLNFANLVKRTRQAKFDEPRCVFENKLKALADLEEHGFPVESLRLRLEELIRIKDGYVILDERSLTAEREVIQKKRKYDEVQESIALLNIKLQTLVMEKEMEGSNIAELQRTIDATKERIEGTRLDFDRIVGSPLVSTHPE